MGLADSRTEARVTLRTVFSFVVIQELLGGKEIITKARSAHRARYQEQLMYYAPPGHGQLERESCAFGRLGDMTDAGSHLVIRPYAAALTPITSSQTRNHRWRTAR
jgi:hypothetical protein